MREITLVFKTAEMVSLWNNEIVGQLSDGYYENWRAGNKSWWINAEQGPENGFNGCDIDDVYYKLGYCNYNIKTMIRELYKYDLDRRMLGYINVAKHLAKADSDCERSYAAHAAGTIVETVLWDDEDYEAGVARAAEKAVAAATEWNAEYYAALKALYPAGTTWEDIVRDLVTEKDCNPRVRRRKIGAVVNEICKFVKQRF